MIWLTATDGKEQMKPMLVNPLRVATVEQHEFDDGSVGSLVDFDPTDPYERSVISVRENPGQVEDLIKQWREKK